MYTRQNYDQRYVRRGEGAVSVIRGLADQLLLHNNIAISFSEDSQILNRTLEAEENKMKRLAVIL